MANDSVPVPLVKRYSIQDALSWYMHRECLRWALTDKAEEELGLDTETDYDCEVTVEGDDFVVTFSAT